MSKEIACKECGYENPHGSKFCNHCGAKLPLSTHIICPNCETPNTLDRVFCDNCGTRLITEKPPKKPDDQESQPGASTPFSLPVRRPGDTGELDPNAVPDWLRTGDISTSGLTAPEAGEQPKPPEKKDTSDLPEWLVHESDPEPIINAPTTISTEFYQDLMENVEDQPQPDDLFADEEANLPDWLADADGAERPAESESESSGLTDWLSNLGEEESPEEPVDSEWDADTAASSGLTDWLQELDDLANPAEAHAAENAAALDNMLDETPVEEADSANWLTELGPAQTDLFEPDSESAEQEMGDELPGWMDELGPLQTNLLDPSQIAELTGTTAESADDPEMIEDEEAGADVSFTGLFETANEEINTLPDWLDTAAESGESFLTQPPPELEAEDLDELSELESDWFGTSPGGVEDDFDWLAESDAEAEEALEREDLQPEEEPWTEPEAPLPFEEELFAGDEAETPEDDAEEAVEDLDWLTDMSAMQTGELEIEEAPEETAVPLDSADEPDEYGLDESAEPESEEEGAEPAVEESWSEDSFFAESSVGEDLPDWLSQLDQPGQRTDSADVPAAGEELPDWIASMRPSEGMFSSELPDVFAEADIRDTLEGIPEELAGAELPDWLQDTPLDGPPLTPLVSAEKESPLEIPDWLRPDEEVEDEVSVQPPADVLPELPESGTSRQEWNVLLEELPPLTPLAESLPKAEIPEWVQQLKPPELTGKPPREEEGPEETTGPLKGMQGIVPLEPAIARPRVALPLEPYVTSPEQQQQVALLRQIALEAPQAVTTLEAKPTYETAVWLRLLLAILIIAVLLVGLRGPSLMATGTAPPASLQAANAAVNAASGQPVLVAVEYTPAFAAELTPQAELLLAQLTANGSPVLLSSQYAAGTAVADTFIQDVEAQMVGYLPGEGIGLRQIGDCMAGRNECRSLNGRELEAAVQSNLSQVALVIVLTGDRDNMMNWIEQVGSVAGDVPLVFGVTQSLTPLARSYAATGQIRGLLGGLPDAAAYAQLSGQSASGLQAQLNAQVAGQFLAGALLLVGLLAYGTSGLVNSRWRKT